MVVSSQASTVPITLSATNTAGTSSFASATSWSNSAAPSSGNDYVVSGGLVLRTVADSGSATFAGGTLTLGNGTTTGTLTLKNQAAGAVVTVNNLTLNNGEIQNGGTSSGAISTVNLAGGITLTSGTSNRINTGTALRGITVSANITGGGALAVTGGGIAMLSGTNNFSGATSIAAGNILQYANTASMSASSAITTTGASTLAVNAGGSGEFTTTGITNLLAGTGTGSTVTLAAGASLGIDTTNASGTLTYSGSFTSANNVGLLKLGTGTLQLTGGGTYAGAGMGGFPLIVRQGTLQLNGGTHTVTGEAVIGGLYGTANGTAGYDAKLQVDSGNLDISGYLSVGRGNGVGAVSSDLVANNSAAITAGNISAGYNGGTATNLPKGSITLNNSSTLTITGNGVFSLAESAGSNMTTTLNNSAVFTAAGTGVKYIGQGGTGILNIKDTSSVSFGSGITYIGYQAGNGTVNQSGGTFTTTGEVQVGGSTTNGTAPNGIGTFAITGGTATVGSLTVARGNNNANTVSGNVSVGAGATLNSAGDVTLGFAGNANLGKLSIDGGTVNVGTAAAKWLVMSQYDTSKGQLDISNGSLNLNNGSSLKALTGNTSSSGSSVINQNGGSINFYSDSGVTLGGSGVLDLALSGSATSTSIYNLDGGTLAVPSVVASNTAGTRLFNFNGGTLKAAADGATLLNLGANTSTVRANVRNGGAKIDTNNFNVTVSQALVHSNVSGDSATDGGLTKSGGGTLSLTAANTYTGVTTVSSGTLALGVGGSIANSSTIDVKSGATLDTTSQSGWALATGQTLKGNGTVDVGSANTLTIGSGAFLAPGASPGNLNVTGNLAFAASSTYTAEISPGTLASDSVSVAGALIIDPTALLAISLFGSDSVLAGGTKFVLVDYTTAWDGVSTFSGLADGSISNFGTLNSYLVDYNDPSLGGTAMTLTVVPEPTSILLASLGAFGLLIRRRVS